MAGAVFLAQLFGLDVPTLMILFFAAYLIIKGGIFVLTSLDWGSFVDVAAGVALLAGLFLAVPFFLLGLFGGILLIKGIFSLLA